MTAFLRPLAVFVVLVLTSGCLGPAHENPAGKDSSAQDPAGTTESPRAFIHDANGTLLEGTPENVPSFTLRLVPLPDSEEFGWEPTLGITGSGAIFLPTIAVRDRDSPAGYSELFLYRSLDEGTTWTRVVPKHLGFEFLPSQSLDSFVFVDPVTDRLYVDMLNPACTALAWTDDLGETWEGSPLACGNPVEDHMSLWASGPTSGRIIHMCSNIILETLCKRSLDGGMTFQGTGSPFSDVGTLNGLAGHGMASPTGSIFIGRAQSFITDANGLPCINCTYHMPVVARSTDHGLTWSSTKVGPRFAGGHDVSLAADGDGNLYAMYFLLEACRDAPRCPVRTSDGPARPVISLSRDDGLTWEPPVDIGFPGLRGASHASILARADGSVAWSYMATTQEGDGPYDWHHYIGMTSEPWPAAEFVTVDTVGRPLVRAQNAGYGNPARGVGDYLDLELLPDGRLVASVVDICQGDCDQNPDVYGAGLPGIVVQARGPSLGARASHLPDTNVVTEEPAEAEAYMETMYDVRRMQYG